MEFAIRVLQPVSLSLQASLAAYSTVMLAHICSTVYNMNNMYYQNYNIREGISSNVALEHVA